MSTVRRRTLLGQIIGGCAMLGIGRWAQASGAHEGPEALLDALLDSFGGLSAVRPLGAAYLKAFPAERELGTVLAALRTGTSPHSAADWLDALRARAREDFEQGRLCRLRGWIVSTTEARLCAAFVLRHTVSV